MVRAKVVGMTRVEDALHAANCGADALGFIFYPGSPRFIDPDRARCIIADLPPFVTTVGLFVNEHPARIREIVEYCGLGTVQLHCDEGPAQCSHPPCRVVKAFRLHEDFPVAGLDDYQVSALLLDAAVPGQYGGTGQLCNWGLAARIAAANRVILAGGLKPENIVEAVQQVRPYGVDVSSGVEKEPGVKDPARVARFIRLAKESIS